MTDPTGAVIPGASIHLIPKNGADGEGIEERTDDAGLFQIRVAEGTYVLRAEAQGFAPFVSQPLSVTSGERLQLPVHLIIASLHEELEVGGEDGLGTLSGGEQVFEGDGLKRLSSDADLLQQQLAAISGSSGTPSFLIDGFSGAKLPPKSSIRSIRINRNPYSAYFSDLGMGRVEVSTRPGADKLHGELDLSGTDQPLDARDPYLPLALPFYDFQQTGNLNGPIDKWTSFFVSDFVESLANDAVINAADPSAPSTTLSLGLPAPQRTDTFSVRLDRQFSANNFAHLRDEWNQVHILNSGINLLFLPRAAFTSNVLTNTLQVADTQTIGSHMVNDVRFQYLRTRTRQDPNSTLPTVQVQGSFQDGGSPAQVLRDNQDAYELQDLFETEHGSHAIRTGFRFRAVRDANESSAGFNGQYIFPNVTSYVAGQPSQFSITTGQQGAVLRDDDVGFFAEDDWKFTPNLTLSYGFRLESQSAVPDHFDPAPRLGFTWAVRPGKRKTPIVTLRGGYGMFYDRFPVMQLLKAVRQNGSREVGFVAQNTGFNPMGLPPGVVLSAAEPTVYRVSPALRTSYDQAASFGATRSLGRFGGVSSNLLYEHNTHNYLTRNINAPLPGTYTPGDPSSGVRPLGTAENIYQFSSDANGNHEEASLIYTIRLSSKFTAFGRAFLEKIYGEIDSIDQFPSNQYDLRQDYARAAIDFARSYSGGFQWSAPLGFQVIEFLAARSGGPFDVTTGTDLNGDTIYNDRPSLAVDPSRSSVVRTAFGDFDTAPVAGQTILPRNFGTSPGLIFLDLSVGRDFHRGPRSGSAAVSTAGGKAGAVPEKPWVLNLSIEAANLINHNNPGVPVGVLSAEPCGQAAAAPCTCTSGGAACALVPSPYFGHSLSLNNTFGPNTASNRTIQLKAQFTF